MTLARRKKLSRGGPPKRRNPKRKKSEFARCYHSRERVRWVKSMNCVACEIVHPYVALGAIDNAHVFGNDGMSRKGGYETIAPLCRHHHREFDERRGVCGIEHVRESIRYAATRVQRLWQEYHAAFTNGANW